MRPRMMLAALLLCCAPVVGDVKLKAPSTAKFAGSGETTRTDLGGGLYRVVSWVDAQNSFGAMIRQRFICEVKFPEKKLKKFEFL